MSVKSINRVLLIVIAAGVTIIACLLAYESLVRYRAAREAEAALAEIGKNKPPRFSPPAPAGVGSQPAPEPIVVTVGEDGVIKISLGPKDVGTVKDADELQARLVQLLDERSARSPDKTVVVKASAKRTYKEVAKVVEAAKEAGAHPVGLDSYDLK